MPTQITGNRRIPDVDDGRDPPPVHGASDMRTQRAWDSMARLVRQGQDASLRSLQMWAELARKLGPHARTPADATVAALDGRWSCVSVGPTGFTLPIAVQQLLNGLPQWSCG